METAPLTLAHTHARNAALETQRANPVAASEEHDLAAAEFAAAAHLTKDNEALRILNLLEQHHKKLGQILKSRHTITVADRSSVTDPGQDATQPTSSPVANVARPSSPENTSQPPRLVRTGKPSARDLSSSIASNLASARGIPSNRQKRLTPISPLVSTQHADGQFSQEDEGNNGDDAKKDISSQTSRRSATASRPPWAPPSDLGDTASTSQKSQADPTASDTPFQQFYGTFESLMSKLSAPLAFAGLPLTTQSAPATSMASLPAKPQPPRHGPPPSKTPLDASINYSQLISRAALRAVSNNDKSSPYGNPSESFYVVPTTGGTTSYAEIMTRANREASHHRRNTSALSTGTVDDFEDASSTILPPPSVLPSRPGLSNEKKYNGKTMEELSLENKALKHLSDTLSKRLHVFEMSAQTSSAALAQSIRSLHLSPLNTPENSRGKSNTTTAFNSESGHGTTLSSSAVMTNPNTHDAANLKSRVSELEDILRKSDAKARKRDDENAKLRDTLGKYRDKWDSLKAGAKARRDRTTGDAVAAAPSSSGKGRKKAESDAGTSTSVERDDQRSGAGAGDGAT